MRRKNYFWGIILVVIGAVGILDKVFHISLSVDLWPLFVLIPGLCFEVDYFSNRDRRSAGLLVPGGILTTIGILFIFETLTNWNYSDRTWPIYTLAVAIGLFQLYLFGGREKGLLIPVGILSAVTVVSFVSMAVGDVFYWIDKAAIIPIILFVAGLYILFGRKKDNKKEDKKEEL